MDALSYFFIPWINLDLLALVAIGTFAGIYVGAIPGLSVTMAVSILISFTFSWEVYPALCLMVGIYMGGVYGGSRTAILLNIPGAPSAIATALDGYPLAQQGKAGEAIGLSTTMSFIAVMIGMFGVAEALIQLRHVDTTPVKQKISRIVPTWGAIRKHLPLSLQTSSIGVIIGALPGTGGDIAALMAYDHAKRVIKNPKVPFGKSAQEGLVAPETANNAAVGGAFIPMITLGIPGDSVTAIIIGALFIHGLNPGPMLMIDKPDMFWFITGALFLANIFMLIFGLTGIRIFTKIVEAPRAVLIPMIPMILMLSIVGAYAVNNSLTDVYFMLGFGVFGYFMKVYGYQVGPVILGVILSRLIDENWRRAIISDQESLGLLMKGIATSPLSLVLFLAVLMIFFTQTPFWAQIKTKTKAKSKAHES